MVQFEALLEAMAYRTRPSAACLHAQALVAGQLGEGGAIRVQANARQIPGLRATQQPCSEKAPASAKEEHQSRHAREHDHHA